MSGLLKYAFTKTKVINNDNNINNSEINPNITKQNIVTNETSLDDDHGTKEMQFESDTEFPDCWDLKQISYFTKEYPWIYFKKKNIGCTICKGIKQNLLDHKGSHVSSEWINGEVYPSGSSLEKKKTNLRKKIAKHKSSIAHLNAQKIVTESEKNVMDEHIFKFKAAEHESTARIFRTAYSIAKYQRPYTDLPKMTDLQILNGLDMGRVLQSNVSCSNIIDHIALEMRKKIALDIIENNRKITILVDESTTLSKKSMLVICLRCAVGEPDDIYTFLFDIVEIPNASAITIKEYILKSLVKFGQFFTSLANNLKQRLFTTQSTKVSSVESNDPSREIFNNLLADLEMISPNNWPDSCDIQYGDTSIRRLSKIFKVDEQASVRGFREYKDFPSSLNDNIKPLMNAVKTLAISSAECERSFSSMNEVVSSKRSLLTSDHISSLAFINCTGPPVNNFKPLPYIKTWLVSGKRSAIEENCPKRLKVNDKTYKSIWSCLEK
ncbi:hypothetical protein ACI65C_011047 [Semiaphis heraclei]